MQHGLLLVFHLLVFFRAHEFRMYDFARRLLGLLNGFVRRYVFRLPENLLVPLSVIFVQSDSFSESLSTGG